jgi:hypothetical protein
MKTSRKFIAACITAGFSFLTLNTQAAAPVTDRLTVSESLRVKGCQSVGKSQSVAFGFRASEFSMQMNDVTLSGSGRGNAKKLNLAMSPASLAALSEYVSELSGCAISSVSMKKSQIKLNKAKTAATLIMQVKVNASTGKGIYQITTSLPWNDTCARGGSNCPASLPGYDDFGQRINGVNGDSAPLIVARNGMSLAVTKALANGDAKQIGDSGELISAINNTIQTYKKLDDASISRIFNLSANGVGSISWDPTHDAALLNPTFGKNSALLTTANGNNLAIVGQADNNRYLVMGANPFRVVGNDGMNQTMLNSLSWLTGKTRGDAMKVVIAQMDESYWFKDESATRSWLKTNWGSNLTTNTADSCDGTALKSCLDAKPDLLIISQVSAADQNVVAIREQVAAAMAAGIPVLYIHHDGDLKPLGKELLGLLNVNYSGDNKGLNDKVVNLDGSTQLSRAPAYLERIATLVNTLQSGSFSFSTIDPDSDAYKNEFLSGAQAIKMIVDELDRDNRDIFSMPNFDIEKMTILLADKYRQEISYPMDVASTPASTFLRAYFADHVVYNSRKVNPAQPNLGTFSSKNLSTIASFSKTVSLTSAGPFRAAGVYALPGRTFRVTRLDSNSDVTTRVFVNSARAGSTHEMDPKGYTRPKFLQSARIPVTAGTTTYVTSPYGGPVEIEFSKSDVNVQLQFEEVGQHPFWRSTEDSASFSEAIARNEYDWAEISAESFEIHSKADRLVKGSMSGTLWSTPETLALAAMRYSHNYTSILAGFQGKGIDQEPEVYGWAQTNGFTMSTRTNIQHMNADQATCGAGCSGNPYDTWGAYEPIEHGNLHEIGHGLQSGRMLLSHGSYTHGVHGATNFYSTYARTRFFEETHMQNKVGGTTKTSKDICNASTPSKTVFDALVAAAGTANPGQTMETRLETELTQLATIGSSTALGNMGDGYNYAMFDQLSMQARKRNKLDNGNHLIARLHIIERAFNSARANETTWAAAKNNLGFGNYSLAEASAIKTNDWIVIAASKSVGLDYRQLLDMLGARFSDKASAQVASLGYTVANVVGRELITSNNYCASVNKNSWAVQMMAGTATPFEEKTIAITSNAVWPW